LVSWLLDPILSLEHGKQLDEKRGGTMRNGTLLAILAAMTIAFAVADCEAGGKRKKLRIGLSVNLGSHNQPRHSRHPRHPRHTRVVRSSGRHAWREVKVWIPGHHEMKWIERQQPDRYEWRDKRIWVPGGTTYRTESYLICAGHWETRFHPRSCPPYQRVWIPPRYGSRQVPVNLPGHWEVRRIQVRIPGEIYRVQERIWCPGHYEYRREKVWVPGAVCAPRRCIRIGGNHGGFGFSLNLSRR